MEAAGRGGRKWSNTYFQKLEFRFVVYCIFVFEMCPSEICVCVCCFIIGKNLIIVFIISNLVVI